MSPGGNAPEAIKLQFYKLLKTQVSIPLIKLLKIQPVLYGDISRADILPKS